MIRLDPPVREALERASAARGSRKMSEVGHELLAEGLKRNGWLPEDGAPPGPLELAARACDALAAEAVKAGDAWRRQGLVGNHDARRWTSHYASQEAAFIAAAGAIRRMLGGRVVTGEGVAGKAAPGAGA